MLLPIGILVLGLAGVLGLAIGLLLIILGSTNGYDV